MLRGVTKQTDSGTIERTDSITPRHRRIGGMFLPHDKIPHESYMGRKSQRQQRWSLSPSRMNSFLCLVYCSSFSPLRLCLSQVECLKIAIGIGKYRQEPSQERRISGTCGFIRLRTGLRHCQVDMHRALGPWHWLFTKYKPNKVFGSLLGMHSGCSVVPVSFLGCVRICYIAVDFSTTTTKILLVHLLSSFL